MTEWAAELDRIRADCKAENWDSYGAYPVSEVALHVAQLVLESLHLSPTPDGGIEVIFADEAFSFRLGPDGLLEEMCGSRPDLIGWLSRKSKTTGGSTGRD